MAICDISKTTREIGNVSNSWNKMASRDLNMQLTFLKTLKNLFTVEIFKHSNRCCYYEEGYSRKENLLRNSLEIEICFYVEGKLNLLFSRLGNTTWKVCKYGVFSGLYFPVFGLLLLRKFPYSVRIQKKIDQKKTPYWVIPHQMVQNFWGLYMTHLRIW